MGSEGARGALFPLALLLCATAVGTGIALYVFDLPPGRAWDAAAASYLRIHDELLLSLGQTLYMVFFSTLFSFLLGFCLATVMIVSGPQGLQPNARLYAVLDTTVDVLRSLPFIILIIAIMPFTRFVMGIAIGTRAAVLPLTIAAAPFAARLIEANFLEVDRGVIEAARSFGAGTFQIIFRVMLPEALPAIILNIAVLAIALLGYSAMAGTVGGGGLGDLAYRLGYNRFQTDVMVWCILVLILLVRGIQSVGNWLYRRLR
jgi:D-methionine transport system permease protein